MAKKSLINTKEFVPQYFANNREFQVFLRAINIALSVVKSNTDNFISNLLNPLKCKARLLPLVANYVGYDYNPRERVLTNRWITKLYPLLIRNRGNELGITLAIAMSICLMGDPEELNLDNNFSMEYVSEKDKYGRLISKLKIYMYTTDYLPILKDMIELVRPAGMKIEYIPAVNMTSTETISLSDEYAIAKYDYVTGKLLSINDIDIIVQNSWNVLIDEQAIKRYKWEHLKNWKWGASEDSTGVNSNTWGYLKDTGINQFAAMPGLAPYNVENKGTAKASYWDKTDITLIDGKFYDVHGNYINRYIDLNNGHILYNDGEWLGEFVKDTRIYATDSETKKEYYTGLYFDVSNPAKVMNTYYKLLDGDIFSGYYLSEDDHYIYDSTFFNTGYYLTDSNLVINDVTIDTWAVNDDTGTINWYVDKATRRFIMLENAKEDTDSDNLPFSSTTIISKKAYIMKKITHGDGTIEFTASKYYINNYGDIVDPAGNIILSKKDRYKVSDSNMIGFSEVHNNAKQISTHDATNILQREWSFMKDNDIQNIWGKNESIPADEYIRTIDPRYKLDHYSFDIGNPVREYTGVELIRFVSNDNLKDIKQDNGWMKIPLFVTEHDSENADGVLKIKTDIPVNYSLADVFKNLNIRYENKVPNNEINPKWDIYIDWVANSKNKSLFNLNDLENPIHFIKCGTIEPRTLHWIGLPIKITPKVYDGTTKVYTKGDE